MSGARIAFLMTLLFASGAQAQAQRRVELRFTPTGRAQLAIWIESADGEHFQTLRLTQSVAVYGIGNRPGALQMNSGFRWPFGRREGVLPIWAHRRAAAQGNAFPRVIFNGRASEGNASSAGSAGEPRNTPDDYFCLSFQRERSGRDALDAVSCASRFNSNKGRYLTDEDASGGYAEPFEGPEGAMMRAMLTSSLYPPRRDVAPCTGVTCGDHETVDRFADDARSVMPAIDAVTMATAAAEREQVIVWDVPADWPDGEYVVFVEANVEGDYNESYNDETHPTPRDPSGRWDYWAINYGYAYRGQPSVLYEVPFLLNPTGAAADTAEFAGYGALHGDDGDVRSPDVTISDSSTAPGSGADRLMRGAGGIRLSVTVPMWDLCNQPDPPVECGRECEPGDTSCGADLICGPDFECVGICDVPMTPGHVEELTITPHDDVKHSHQWARFSFRVPDASRGIARYEVRVGTEPIVDLASFERALPALEPTIESIELRVPTAGAPGELLEIEFGGLTPQQHYYVGVRAFDSCNAPSALAVGELETTEIHFTTVSPCFVATAAYGTPLASEIGALRRLRDRHLRTNAPGRAIVAAYYTLGPPLARVIEGDERLRSAARVALAPLVSLARWLD